MLLTCPLLFSTGAAAFNAAILDYPSAMCPLARARRQNGYFATYILAPNPIFSNSFETKNIKTAFLFFRHIDEKNLLHHKTKDNIMVYIYNLRCKSPVQYKAEPGFPCFFQL